MCSTKARRSVKVYIPNKPHKWGYKLFVLSGASSFAYNFEFFTGQENNSELRNINEPDLGSSVNMIVRLARIIPELYLNVKIINYFSIIITQPYHY